MMTDDELQQRTEAIDAEFAALDDQCRQTWVRAYLLRQCGVCKRDRTLRSTGLCNECYANEMDTRGRR